MSVSQRGFFVLQILWAMMENDKHISHEKMNF